MKTYYARAFRLMTELPVNDAKGCVEVVLREDFTRAHKALRFHAITTAHDASHCLCMECAEVWPRNEPERHAPNCPAALAEDGRG